MWAAGVTDTTLPSRAQCGVGNAARPQFAVQRTPPYRGGRWGSRSRVAPGVPDPQAWHTIQMESNLLPTCGTPRCRCPAAPPSRSCRGGPGVGSPWAAAIHRHLQLVRGLGPSDWSLRRWRHGDSGSPGGGETLFLDLSGRSSSSDAVSDQLHVHNIQLKKLILGDKVKLMASSTDDGDTLLVMTCRC